MGSSKGGGGGGGGETKKNVEMKKFKGKKFLFWGQIISLPLKRELKKTMKIRGKTNKNTFFSVSGKTQK